MAKGGKCECHMDSAHLVAMHVPMAVYVCGMMCEKTSIPSGLCFVEIKDFQILFTPVQNDDDNII